MFWPVTLAGPAARPTPFEDACPTTRLPAHPAAIPLANDLKEAHP